MTSGSVRCGTSLVEVLVAVVLLLIVVQIGGVSARTVLARESRVATLSSRSSAIADGLQTLARHVASADPSSDDLQRASASVLDVVTTIGVASACRIRGDTLVISSGDSASPWFATLPRAVTSDDAVRVWTDRDGWVDRRILSVASGSGACGESFAPWPGAGSQRLVLNDTLPGSARPGGLVRVLSRERWSLTLGGDGNWSLTRATWNAGTATFSVPQPLVSPLATLTAATGAGFTVRAADAAGSTLADSALRKAHFVDVVMRGRPHVRYGAITDSVRIHVAAP